MTNKLTEQERLQYAGTLNAQHAQEESWLCTAFKHLSVEEKRTIIRECMEKGFINNLKKFMSEK